MSSLMHAFREYHAKPTRRECYSALAGDDIVLCLWERHFRTAPGAGLRYEGQFAGWEDGPAKAEFREHLQLALAENRVVRLVVGHVHAGKAPDLFSAGQRATAATQTFDVRKDLVGRVTALTDDVYVIDFRKSA